jgi:hypothetical protein
MRAPPTWIVDRGTWKLYLGAGLVVLIGLFELALGYWGFALATFTFAFWIGVHPYLRRTWFEIGYDYGYDEGIDDAARQLEGWRHD